jgi:mRNA interferase MazF
MRRGEIYFVDFDPIIGREQSGRRPALVLSIDVINSRPLVVTVVPGTDGANVRGDYPSTVRLAPTETGLPVETVFLCFQVRALDHSRFPTRPAGHMSAGGMRQVNQSVRYCLGL